MAVGAINGFFVAVVGIKLVRHDAGDAVSRSRALALIVSHGDACGDPWCGAARDDPRNVTHIVNGQFDHPDRTRQTTSATFRQSLRRGGVTYSELIWAGWRSSRSCRVVLTFTRWGSVHGFAIGSNKLGAGGRPVVQVEARDDPQLRPLRADGGPRSASSRRSARRRFQPDPAGRQRNPVPRCRGGP